MGTRGQGQGPVRALARDYVDSRRRISEYYMYGLGVLVVLLFLPATRLIVDYLVLGVVLIMLAEGTFLGGRSASSRPSGTRASPLAASSSTRASGPSRSAGSGCPRPGSSPATRSEPDPH